MELTLTGDAGDDDLRPITRVMYASALIPGGEYSLVRKKKKANDV